MVGTKSRSKSKIKKPAGKKLPFHAFWSGSLSFGLVNVPVLVFPATRHGGVRLHMQSAEGSLLQRRYVCPRDGTEVSGDDIVRGYELDDGTYITVTDAELEAVEPDKSREIDLREFVDLSEISPALFERGYYLTPTKEATKAYRLLAEVMQKSGRAGIATFVMRDREYLVAIFAENGILCAETLRFHDEIRTSQEIGLPVAVTVSRQRQSAFERAIDALSKKTIATEELVDQDDRGLRVLIDRKKRARKNLIRNDRRSADGGPESEDEIDLLETIRQSLRQAGKGRT
jgi:DNA end-binding protein Ku